MTSAGHKDKALVVWGAVLGGYQKIVHSSNKLLKDLVGAEIVLEHPNPTHTNSLLVVINGEHIGTFVHRVTNEGPGAEGLAVCQVVIRKQGSRDTVTDMTLKLPGKDLAIVKETDKERNLNKGILAAEHEAARVHR